VRRRSGACGARRAHYECASRWAEGLELASRTAPRALPCSSAVTAEPGRGAERLDFLIFDPRTSDALEADHASRRG